MGEEAGLMPWFYVDDGFSDSKPVLNMPDRYRLAACGLWVLAGSWSAKEETDGLVPGSKLRQLGARAPIIAALTDSGPLSAPLCTRVSDGIQFNSWDKWQPTKAELVAERIENERKREAEAERKRNERAAKNGTDPGRARRRRKGRNAVTSTNTGNILEESETCPTGQTTDIQRDSRAGAGARLDPTRPDPTRPTNPLADLGGGVTQVAPTEIPPRPQCPDHKENSEGKCHHCKLRRQWDEDHAAKIKADELDRRREAKAAAQQALHDCRLCDEYGWLLGEDGTPVEPPMKCTVHQQAVTHA
ncbi:hypothetical protein [Mycobacterium marinum]|nr:hypothetical protein [Mycobacterium marinum]